MDFLIDHNVYKITVDFLISSGHNIVSVSEINMQSSKDEEVLSKANETKRILITRDKDFGLLVFLKQKMSSGVILLRGRPSKIKDVHKLLSIESDL